MLDTVAAKARVLARSGLVPDPGTLLHMVRALRTWDRTPAGLLAGRARSRPDSTFVIDELGSLTYGEVDLRTNAIANELAHRGVRAGDRAGVMCRNHRGFVEAVLACSKLGVTVLLLNTDFAGPQLAGVLEREAPAVVIYDEEFEVLLAPVAQDAVRVLGWTDGETSLPTLAQLASSGDPSAPAPPDVPGRMIILSSGTTGTPKGVGRAGATPLGPLIGLLDRVPLRGRETMVIPAPLFHGWGFLHFALSLMLGGTIVVRRRFDPEATLALIAEHRATSAPMVPVMLQRIMELDPSLRARHDVSSLRTIPLGGSAIPAGLAVRAMNALGDVVYNIYGSTEVALATAATPRDLREAPGTAGRAMAGTPVRILDAAGHELPKGETGVVFVRSAMASDGYSGGGAKLAIDGLLSSGDLGHFDEHGRLFIDGREDEMIVSGGENVYPGEVEDLIAGHEGVAEVAVVGVPDESFGQRLRAFVVLKAGADVSADDIRAHVRAGLARYKVPRDVEFLDRLPRNPTGKVLKRELVSQ